MAEMIRQLQVKLSMEDVETLLSVFRRGGRGFHLQPVGETNTREQLLRVLDCRLTSSELSDGRREWPPGDGCLKVLGIGWLLLVPVGERIALQFFDRCPTFGVGWDQQTDGQKAAFGEFIQGLEAMFRDVDVLTKRPVDGANPGGRPRNKDDDWAWRQVNELRRAPQDVYPEWKERIGPRDLADPLDSFKKAVALSRGKGKNGE